LDRGYEVACLVRKNLGWLETLPVEKRKGDCTDPATLTSVARDIDVVFHVAGLTKALRTTDYFLANTQGTKNLLEACAPYSNRIKKWVYVSSLASAGPSQEGIPLEETHPCHPVSPYGWSKLAGERIATSFKDRFPIVIVRPPAVYGPRDADFYPLFRLAQYGFSVAPWRGERYLSLCFVDDLVEGTILGAESGCPSGSIYNLSEETVHSWRSVAEAIGHAVNRKISSVRVPSALLFLAAGFLEIIALFTRRVPVLTRGKALEMIQTHWTCNPSKAIQELGFRPKVSLAEGAKRTVQWYREAGWLDDHPDRGG
jgi:nucleoside-diphosphate-sugar epimerase